MTPLQAQWRRWTRGPASSRLLDAFGIRPQQYWLLTDLWQQLATRRELLGQLGRDGVSLAFVSGGLVLFSVLLTVLALVARTSAPALLATSTSATAFIVLFYSLSEVGNSLVNPGESLILAHHPINGATYTAAKLSHLLKLLAALVLALNLLPAVTGWMLRGGSWSSPLRHMGVVLAVGLGVQLLVCAFYGWLIRWVPAARLKTVSQGADILLFVSLALLSPALQGVRRFLASHRFVVSAEMQSLLLGALVTGTLLFAIFGLRALRADFLLRSQSILRGHAHRGRRRRFGWLHGLLTTGLDAPGRAGMVYTQTLMRRDWTFLKQLVLCVYVLFGLIPPLVRGLPKSPFRPEFTAVHLFPHGIGVCAMFVCMMLPYGSDSRGAWIFQSAASRAFDSFAKGIHRALWIALVAVPHLVLVPFAVRFWGLGPALLFISYSVALVSLYLAVELRLVEQIPFSRQLDAGRSAVSMPIMIVAGLVVAAVAAVQYFVLFRSPVAVGAVTLVIAFAAWAAARNSIRTLAADIRFQLSTASDESGSLYVEV